jgi:hypothetical protein
MVEHGGVPNETELIASVIYWKNNARPHPMHKNSTKCSDAVPTKTINRMADSLSRAATLEHKSYMVDTHMVYYV